MQLVGGQVRITNACTNSSQTSKNILTTLHTHQRHTNSSQTSTVQPNVCIHNTNEHHLNCPSVERLVVEHAQVRKVRPKRLCERRELRVRHTKLRGSVPHDSSEVGVVGPID